MYHYQNVSCRFFVFHTVDLSCNCCLFKSFLFWLLLYSSFLFMYVPMTMHRCLIQIHLFLLLHGLQHKLMSWSILLTLTFLTLKLFELCLYNKTLINSTNALCHIYLLRKSKPERNPRNVSGKKSFSSRCVEGKRWSTRLAEGSTCPQTVTCADRHQKSAA